jgi:precorrin-6A/cobalt-precorrin-6A reductase
VSFAPNHEEAARAACAFGKPILLTIGIRNLAPYVFEGKRAGLRIVARVLPVEASLEACREAGLADDSIIRARGPFSVEENRAALRRHGIGVLVTKDSGEAGGAPEKVEAANLEGCETIVVERPEPCSDKRYQKSGELIAALKRRFPGCRSLESRDRSV